MKIVAKHNEQFFKQYIDLENGIPGHDTIRRVMALINPAILQNLVNEWHELISHDETQTIQNSSMLLTERTYAAINTGAAYLHTALAHIAATTAIP